MAKVSIIIPTYNVEEYLEECMNSVVRQTLQDIEIVCVNDGSTDSSLEILKRYAEKDDRVVIVDQQNGGYGKAMNAGFDRATGEYIGIVEPDDYVSLDMYEDLYNTAKEYDLDFVKSDFYRFVTEEKGGMKLTYYALTPEKEKYNVVFNPSETPDAMNYVMNTWCGIYRRAFLEEYGIRHNETPGASFQDNGFFFQTFAFAKRAMIVDKAYYRNRRDNPNSSVHDPGKVYAANIEYDYIRDLIMEHPETWKRFKYMYWKKRFTNTLTTIDRIGMEHKMEYARNASREFNGAKKNGLIRRQEYNDSHWDRMQMILKDPETYVLQRMNLKKADQIKAEVDAAVKKAAGQKQKDSDAKRLQEILDSNSYKLGFGLTAGPRAVKRILKKAKKDPKAFVKKIAKDPMKYVGIIKKNTLGPAKKLVKSVLKK